MKLSFLWIAGCKKEGKGKMVSFTDVCPNSLMNMLLFLGKEWMKGVERSQECCNNGCFFT